MINKHLSMWRELSATGGGELAGRLHDPATGMPFAVLGGTCDSIKGSKYFDDVQGRTRTRVHEFSIHGANHNFFNTQWSPAGGQAGAVDDAGHEGLPPGQCTDGNLGSVPHRQLTEHQQRLVGSAYAAAFFQRYLQGRTEFDPMLTGRVRPFAWLTPVDLRYS